MSWLPNALCVLRMVLAAPVAWCLYHHQYGATFAVFLVAALTDGLDGYIAKKYGWTSELGKVLDPLADKLLLVTVFITLAVIGKVAQWLVVLVVVRDVVISFGAIMYRRMGGSLSTSAPTAISKLNTVMQITLVLALVAEALAHWPSQQVILILEIATALTTLISGIDYTVTYIRRAAALPRSSAGH